MASRAARLCLAVLALCAASCQFVRPQPGVLVSSTPPGAEVYVDGDFTGFVTPARFALATDDWHRLDLRLPGHRSEMRLVGPGGRVTAIDWRTGSIALGTFWFPLFLPLGALVPFSYESRSSPQRLHVYLRRSAR